MTRIEVNLEWFPDADHKLGMRDACSGIPVPGEQDARTWRLKTHEYDAKYA